MAVRKITNNTVKSIYLFPSLKMGRLVWADGPLEYDYLHLLEPDSEVTSYEGQPLRIRYKLKGERRLRFYTPDFLVRRGERKQIVEVKLKKDAKKEEFQRLFRIAARACSEEGYEFIVVDEETIRLQPRLYNLKLFWRYAKTPIGSSRYRYYCRELFGEKPQVSLADVVRFFEAKNATRREVYALLFWGFLATDLMQPLCPQSIITYPALAAPREAHHA